MAEKKESANWNIAATHYLTAGFVMPVITMLITYFLIIPNIGIKSVYIIYLILAIMLLLWVFLWVIYSANYVKKTYIVKDIEQVIKLSTIYFLVIGILSNSYRFFSGKLILNDFVFMLLVILISTPIFYIVSKKYLLEK